MTNVERRRRIRESIATTLACTLTYPKDTDEDKLMRVSKRLEEQVFIHISHGASWNWEFADEYFHNLVCEALDGRL